MGRLRKRELQEDMCLSMKNKMSGVDEGKDDAYEAV